MSINIVESIATANKCYQADAALVPRGIILLSCGKGQTEKMFGGKYRQKGLRN